MVMLARDELKPARYAILRRARSAAAQAHHRAGGGVQAYLPTTYPSGGSFMIGVLLASVCYPDKRPSTNTTALYDNVPLCLGPYTPYLSSWMLWDMPISVHDSIQYCPLLSVFSLVVVVWNTTCDRCLQWGVFAPGLRSHEAEVQCFSQEAAESSACPCWSWKLFGT